MPKEVLSLVEFQNYLRIGQRKALQLLETGQVPGRKIGTRWRVHRADVINWLHSGKGLTEKVEQCEDRSGSAEKTPGN